MGRHKKQSETISPLAETKDRGESIGQVASELAAQAESEQTQQATSPAEKPRKKRQSTDEKAVLEQAMQTCAWAFGLLASMPYDVLSKKYPDIWTITPQERENLGQAAMVLANRYLPRWLEKFPEVAAFVMINVVIILPRAPAWFSAMKKKTAEKEKKTNDSSDTRTPGIGKDDAVQGTSSEKQV